MPDTCTTLSLVDGLHFRAETANGHVLSLDSRLDADGHGEGPSPMQLQLIALGGCGAMDTISILRKMRQDVTAYTVRLSYERAAEHPRVYTSVLITHELHGRAIAEAMVRRAIGLTMVRYCPVFAMLQPSVAIRERYELVDAAGAITAGAITAGEVMLDEAREQATAPPSAH